MNELSIAPFGEEMDQLAGEVSRLGGLAESQIADCLDAGSSDIPADTLFKRLSGIQSMSAREIAALQ